MTDDKVSKEVEQIEVEESKSVTRRKAEGDNPTKAAAAVGLRMAGAPFEAIAEELGYSNATAARNAYERALAASAGDYRDIEHQRILATKRLEGLLLSIWGKATDTNHVDQIPAQRTALAIVDRIIRIQGTDAPQQMVIRTPDKEVFEDWLRKAFDAVSPQERAEEEEIIDAEVLPGD